MHRQNWIALLLSAGLLLAMVGGTVLSGILRKNDVPTENSAQEKVSAEPPPPEVLLPNISDRPQKEQADTDETAENMIDVGVMERETGPAVIGGRVEYETKEKQPNEEP